MPEYIIQITIEPAPPGDRWVFSKDGCAKQQGAEYGMLFALTNKGRIFYRATHPESDWMEMRTPLELATGGGF